MPRRFHGLDFDDSTVAEGDEDLTPFERRAKTMTPQEGVGGLQKRVRCSDRIVSG